MTDLNSQTKPALNDMLAKPLTASALKKTAKADLVAMVQAQPPKLTDLEKRVLVAYADAGTDCNGAETVDAMLADNMTWGDVPEIAKATGLTQKQVQGVIASLSTKGLLLITDEAVNGEGPVQQVLADNGIRVAFDLMPEGVEAKDALKARKRHLLAEALAKGATIEKLMAVTSWNKDTVSSALRTDIGALGLGVERKGGKYFLLLPKGVKCIPSRYADTTRAAALVAACK